MRGMKTVVKITLAVALLVIGAYIVLPPSRTFILAFWPYLFLAICPLAMMGMMGMMGGMDSSNRRVDQSPNTVGDKNMADRKGT